MHRKKDKPQEKTNITEKSGLRMRQIEPEDFDNVQLDDKKFAVSCRFCPEKIKVIEGRLTLISFLSSVGEMILKNMDVYVIV